MKKRDLIIGAGILIVIIALAVYFIITGNKQKNGNNTENALTIQEVHQFKSPTDGAAAMAESGVSAVSGAEYKELDAKGLGSVYGITEAPEDFCVIQSTGADFFEIAVIKGDAAQIKMQYIQRVESLKKQYADDSGTLEIVSSPIIKSFHDYAIMIIGKDKVQIEANIDNYFN